MTTDAELLAALLNEDTAIQTKARQAAKASELPELHKWLSTTLSDALATRNPMFLDRGELSQLMRWKLAREKWRPRLVQLVESNSEQVVKDVTMKAAIAAKDISDFTQESILSLVDILIELKGVGPATASLILSLYCPRDIPFFSDEAVLVMGLGKADYSKKFYVQFHRLMKERAASETWADDITRLERACWCHTILEKQASKGDGETKPKNISRIKKK